MKQLFEIKSTRQVEIYRQELDRLHQAGFTGREVLRVALEEDQDLSTKAQVCSFSTEVEFWTARSARAKIF